MKLNAMTTNFDPHECVIFVQSTKIGTNDNKTIHSNKVWETLQIVFFSLKLNRSKWAH